MAEVALVTPPIGALAVTVLTGTVEIRDGLSGFAHPVTWLVLAAFFIARGFIKTGLGTRVAYFFIPVLGRTSLGLGYGLVVSDLFLAPAIPSTKETPTLPAWPGPARGERPTPPSGPLGWPFRRS